MTTPTTTPHADPTSPTTSHLRMPTPQPRGPVSTTLLAALRSGTPDELDPGADGTDPLAPVAAALEAAGIDGPDATAAVLTEDVQLALLVMYELHYRGVDGIDDAWEWHPGLLALRARIERPFEAALRARVPQPACDATDAAGVAARLFRLAADDDSPSLSRYVARKADAAQALELIALRSVYQLKEADPHTWAIPRLSGVPKAALVEIQSDEYGGGHPGHMHHELYARTMRGMGLDDAYGAYLDAVPGVALVAVNTMSLLGLHRRLRGAIVGHLAAYEMTSSIPCRQYSNGLRRLGHDEDVTGYFDEHVEADAVHEQIAGRDLAGRLAEQEPALRDDVLWGAALCLAVEGDVGAYAMERWQHGEPALRVPLPAA
jgi:hypothetical protein